MIPTHSTLIWIVYAYWTVGWIISFVYGHRQAAAAYQDAALRKAEGVNGPAEVETHIQIRRAFTRIIVSFAGVIVGLVSFLITTSPGVPMTFTQLLSIFSFLTIETVYVMQAVLDGRDRSRQLRLLRRQVIREKGNAGTKL